MKTLSRQRRWQLKQLAQGKCTLCGAPIATATLCLRHALAAYERQRKSKGSRRRNNSLTSRLIAEHGTATLRQGLEKGVFGPVHTTRHAMLKNRGITTNS